MPNLPRSCDRLDDGHMTTAFHQFIVAFNSSYRILNRLPMRCNGCASRMFATDKVNSCTCVIRKSIYTLMTRIWTLFSPILKSIVVGDVYCTSALHNLWILLLYNNYVVVLQTHIISILVITYTRVVSHLARSDTPNIT